MTWVYPDRNVYALALEHQGTNNPKKIMLDIKKLSVLASPKILMVYRQTTNEVQKWIKDELKKTGIEAGYFLLINIPDYFRDKPPIKKLEARLIDEHTKVVNVGTAEARKERITGLRFFSSIKWFPKR